MSMKLYSYYRSSASYRVRIALHYKSLVYDYLPIHLLNDGGEQNQNHYREINPMGQVPCLIHDGLSIGQSMAILFYLDRIRPLPRLFPEETKAFARCVQLCEIVNSGIHPIQNLKVLQYIETEFAVGKEGKVKWAVHWIDSGFTALENTLRRTCGKYALGDQLTAADMFIVPQVYNARRFHLDMSRFPLIERIEKNCLELEIFQTAAPETQPDTPEENQ